MESVNSPSGTRAIRTFEKVRAEMSLNILAYNLKRMIAILGVQPLIQAMRAA